MISAIIKITIWVIPVILLVKVVEKKKPLSYLGLLNFRKGLKWAIWGFLILAIYFFTLNVVILNNDIHLTIGFNEWINTIILVGLIEEIVFRGFILRKFMEDFEFWKANTITSILFVFIHFPIWFYKGLFGFPYIVGASITAFVLGLVFGWIYKKSNSLWSVIIIHSLYNFFVSLFH